MLCHAGMAVPDSQDDHPPKKRRKRRKITEADIGLFIRQYGRKAYRNHDPNDRSYDREIEEKIKRMSPEHLDRLMRGDDQENVDEQHID
ncbi:MAG: hypothetical protein FJ267_02890 [Planctomycetes bacterium]|nr:hypothetical protein [Planctomycetota bacterium]